MENINNVAIHVFRGVTKRVTLYMVKGHYNKNFVRLRGGGNVVSTICGFLTSMSILRL